MPMAGCHKSRGKYIVTGGYPTYGKGESQKSQADA